MLLLAVSAKRNSKQEMFQDSKQKIKSQRSTDLALQCSQVMGMSAVRMHSWLVSF